MLHKMLGSAATRQGVRATLGRLLEPGRRVEHGLELRYVPFLAGGAREEDGTWGGWAAWPLALALRRLEERGGFDLVHAHGVLGSGEAARRALEILRMQEKPLIVSVAGGELFDTKENGRRRWQWRSLSRHDAIRRTLQSATVTLARSGGVAELAATDGAAETRVVHPGVDVPARLAPTRLDPPRLVTVGELLPRKRHADVIRALAVLSKRHRDLRYTIVGNGGEEAALKALARRLGVAERVELAGRLAREESIKRARRSTLFVMPSTNEAFGLAYVEAMAAGVPALGCRGEPGPEEIAAAGAGLVLVPPGDIERLSQRIDELLSDRERLRTESRHARETVAKSFTWERCGAETVRAYEQAMRSAGRAAGSGAERSQRRR
jgi:glycosyltransferase involved in cell wall biosynthesis